MKSELKAGWSGALLVCAKCSKKLDGGFGPKDSTRLAKVLAKRPGVGRKRKAGLGVAEVRCLGVCPRGAVTVVDTRAPGRWRLVRPGDDLDAIVAGVGVDATLDQAAE